MTRSTLITKHRRQYLVDGSGVRPLRINVAPAATVQEAAQPAHTTAREVKAPSSPEPEDIFAAIEKKLGSMVLAKKKSSKK